VSLQPVTGLRLRKPGQRSPDVASALSALRKIKTKDLMV
jgi:hypothetical protein